MGRPDALPRGGTIESVLNCQYNTRGFGTAPGYDTHLLYTVSAVQILATVDASLWKGGRFGKCRFNQQFSRVSIVFSALLISGKQ